MVKIRLEGLLDDIKEATEKLRKVFRILNESAPYANRGKSAYCRTYIDLDFEKIQF